MNIQRLGLNTVLKCVDNTDKIDSLQKIVNKVFVYLNRLYFLMTTGVWHNNKLARRVVKYYLYEAAIAEKNGVSDKIQDIFNKLKPNDLDISLLDRELSGQGFKRLKKTSIPMRMLFHIHGDEFGNGSGYEGLDGKSPLAYLYSFLQQRKKSGLDLYGGGEDLLAELEPGKTFQRSIEEAFQKQQPRLLHGGWVGSPGHAMFYEVIPTSETEATVRYYNLGSGSGQHNEGVEGVKLKAIPYFDLCGVKKETLLNPNTLKALVELQTAPWKLPPLVPGFIRKFFDERDRGYNPKDIYEGLIDLLEPGQVVAGGIDAEELKTRQRAGTCAWRSLLAFLATRLEKGAFKRLVLDIKLQSLADSVSMLGWQSLNARDFRLLHKSHRKLCRRVHKAFSSVGEKYSVRASDKLKKIGVEIAKRRNEALKPKTTWSDLYGRCFQRVISGCFSIMQNLSNEWPLHQQIKGLSGSPQPFSNIVEKLKHFKGDLKELLLLCQKAEKNGEYHGLHVGLVLYFKNFSLEYRVMDKAQAEEKIGHLKSITKLYFLASFRVPEAHLVHADRTFTMLKLLYMHYKLAAVIEPNTPLARLPELYKSSKLFYQYLDASQQAEFNAMQNEITEKGWLWEYNVVHGLAAHASTLFPEWVASVTRFSKLSPKQINAAIYVRGDLPEWFLALRDTQLYYLMLNSCSLIRERGDGSIQFKVENRSEDGVSIKFKCSGLKNPEKWTDGFFHGYGLTKSTNPIDLYRPVKKQIPDLFDSSSKIKNVIALMDEKSLLTHSFKGMEQADEALREFLRILTDANTRIAEGFIYFFKYPEKLLDLESQVYFQLVFKPELLLRELRIEGFADKLDHFLASHIDACLARDLIQPAVFLLRMSRLFAESSPGKSHFQGSLDKLRRILTRSLSPEEKGVVHSEIAAHLGRKSTLDPMEVKELLVATVYLNFTPTKNEWRCPQVEKDVRDALVFHADSVLQTLYLNNKPNQALLHRVTEDVCQVTGGEWEAVQTEGEFPFFRSNRFTYFPLNAELITEEPHYLPIGIRGQREFTRLFPGVEKGVLGKGGVWQFTFEERETLVTLTKQQELIVEQKWGKEWFRYIDKSSLVFEFKDTSVYVLGSIYLTHYFDHWRKVGASFSLLIVDPKTLQPRYVARTLENYVRRVESLETGAVLQNASQLLQPFEHPLFIHEWNDGKIELPRFGLTFTNSLSDQFDGFSLTQNFLPYLGTFRNYLVLQKGNTCKVLFPRQLLTPVEEPEVLQPLFEVSQSPGEQEQHYYVFDLTEDGTLFTKSREANLYLSLILTAVQEYESAAKLLTRYRESVAAFTNEEDMWLRNICNMKKVTGDQEGNGYALRVLAGNMLFKNSGVLPFDFQKNLQGYLEHEAQATAWRFTAEERLSVEKWMEANTFSLPSDQVPSTIDKMESIDAPINPPSAVFPSFMTTRITWELKEHLATYYHFAKNGNAQQKNAISSALKFVRYQEEPRTLLLECVLEHSDQFPPSPSFTDNIKSEQLNKWWSDVKKIAAGLIQPRQALVIKKNPIVPKAPQAEAKEIAVPPIPLSFKLEAIPPFVGDWFEEKKLNTLSKNELLNWLAQETNSEPLYKNEIKRLIEDCNYQSPEVQYTLKPGALESIQKTLIPRDRKESLEEIKNLANRPPLETVERAKRELQLQGKTYEPLSKEELLLFFAKNDPASLYKRNPVLTPAEINIIFEKIGRFLIEETHEQHRLRGLKDPQKLLEQRRYDPNQHPAYLVFEYYADILLRPAQVDNLKMFLEGKDPNPVLEMIMGSGKSKVLLPLLTLLRADGDTLSMIIVPNALFESIGQDTQEILATFLKSLKKLHIDRNLKLNVADLDLIYSDLTRIQKNGDGLIMTSKSVQCLILKYVEKRHSKAPIEEIKRLEEILYLLGVKGFPVFDEVDTAANVMHEVCFSLGQKGNPDPDQIQIIATLYAIIGPINGSLTEDQYQKVEKMRIAKSFMEAMKKIEFSSKEKQERVQRYFQNLKDPGALLYLCHDKKGQKFFDAQNEEIQDILALSAEVISNYLPHTLTQNYNERYGIDDKGNVPIGIPYAAANTPSYGSEFANPFIAMCYTFQSYLIEGISKEVVRNELIGIQSQVTKSLEELGTTLEKIPAWILFVKIKENLDMPLFKYTEEQLDALQQQINSSIARKLLFIGQVILPKMQLFPFKLSCNPFQLFDFFTRLLGFTGTLWNSKSMHRKVTPKPELGTDSKTLKILWQNSFDAITIIKGGTPEAMLAELGPFDLISDAGGYFKHGGNECIAKKIATIHKQPVVYYNSRGEQVETDGKSSKLLNESTTSIHARKTFLDQSHTIGADVKQRSDAMGVVTIGRNLLLRDLLQSVWRLRELDKGQKVKFVISEEVEMIMRDVLKKPTGPLNFDSIFRFGLINQVKQQGRDNFKALLQELRSLSEMLLFQVAIDPKYSEEQKEAAYARLEREWVRQVNLPPHQLFGQLLTEEDSDPLIKMESRKAKLKLAEIFKDLPFLEEKGIYSEITRIAERLKGCLLSKVAMPIREVDDDQTVELEQNNEKETELEEVKSIELPNTVLTSMRHRSMALVQSMDEIKHVQDSHSIPYCPLSVYLKTVPDLSPLQNAFVGIDISKNVFQEGNIPIRLFGAHRTPLHFVRVLDGDKVILLSQADAISFRESYYNEYQNLYHVAHGFYDQKRPVSQLLKEKIAKVKFLNGDSTYTKEELQILENWIRTWGVERMQALFEKQILAGFPIKLTNYARSDLRKLFQKIE